MPCTAIHQGDQLKSATSNGWPPRRSVSAGLTRKETLLMPAALASRRATAILDESGSMAITLEASSASWRVSLPSPHPISRIRLPLSRT